LVVNGQGWKNTPRCKDCGTQARDVRQEIVMSGFGMRVRAHFVCSSCGLMQTTERREHPARLVLALAS
jgi:hypothetical protein